MKVACSRAKRTLLGLALASLWGCATPKQATTHRLPDSLLSDKGPTVTPANVAAGSNPSSASNGVRKASLSEEDLASAPSLPDPNTGGGRDTPSAAPSNTSANTEPSRVDTLLRLESTSEPSSMPGNPGAPRPARGQGLEYGASTPLQRMEGRIQEMTLELEAIDPSLADEFLAATRKAAEGGNLETVLVAWRATIEHRQRQIPDRDARFSAKPVSQSVEFDRRVPVQQESVLTPIPEGMPRRSGSNAAEAPRDVPTKPLPIETGTRITAVEPETRTIETDKPREGGSNEPVRLTYRSPEAATERASLEQPRNLDVPANGSSGDVESRMLALARDLEKQESLSGSDSLRAQVHSRLLYLMAGESRQGLKPVFGSDGIDRKYWQGYLWSLQQFFDAKSIPRPEGRAAESILSLQEAIAALRQRADLEITTPVLCSNVVGYGIYEEFPNYTFRAGQTVVVYWELRNFSSVETKDGYRTRTSWAFEIIDTRGDRRYRFGREFGDDLCRNQRQDYFNVVKFTLPADITPGEYTLKVISTDKTTDKVAEKQIRFVIQ